MERYAFPADFADTIIKRWDTRLLGVFRRPTLPSWAQLLALLEVAYMASLETDEGRAIRFTICCTPNTGAVKRFQQDDEVETWNFGAPRPFDIQELRRLAVTTDIDASALWVQFPPAAEGPLSIRGLLNLGKSWAHARDAFAFHFDALPEALTVRAEGPGILTAYQGQIPLATLAGGKIREGRFTAETLHGLHPLLDEGHRHFAQITEPPRFAPPRLSQEFAWSTYVNVLLATVNAIKRGGHGGALILTGKRSVAADPASRLIRMKYRMEAPIGHLGEHYTRLVNKRSAMADLQWQIEDQDQLHKQILEPPVPPLNELRLSYAEVRDANQALAEACNFVGNLAGADGALVLRTDLTLVGFGAEIVMERAAPVSVYEVRNMSLRGAELMDSEQFGMRHRSAMRLCAVAPDVAVFVVSQDGGVSLVFQADGQVYFRRNISTTNANMVFS